MPWPSASKAFARSIWRRFRRNRRGSAVVEFALVAPIFIGLLFAIIEVALVFFASQVLETVTQDSARLIFTGQAQGLNYTQTQFKDYVCTQITTLFNCPSGIYVDVESYPSFSSVTINDPIDANKNFLPTMNYSPGGPGDIVVVRLFYQWPLFVTGFGFNLSNLAGHTRLLAATAAFRNEPF